jgi:hypothetical protein
MPVIHPALVSDQLLVIDRLQAIKEEISLSKTETITTVLVSTFSALAIGIKSFTKSLCKLSWNFNFDFRSYGSIEIL